MNLKIDKYSYNTSQFYVHIKNQCYKSIKISVITIVKITDINAEMQNELNCQITSIRKMSAKLFKNFPNFCEMLSKQFAWM